MRKENIKLGEYLFGPKKLSGFVSKINKTVGIKGSINELRHIKISDSVRNLASAEERFRLSEEMGHTPVTQQAYVRNISVN
jgi:hypothetical protein